MDRRLGLIGLPLLPWAAGALALGRRTRIDWAERMGLQVPPVQPGALWLHASSVGELAAVEALLPHLSGPLLVTTDSDTGAARARTLGVPAGVVPLDHPWCFAPLLAEARPRGLVFVESAYWPLLAAAVRRLGVPVMAVSARESPATARRRASWPALFPRPALVLARDPAAAETLAARFGAPVETGGDLKAERPVPAPTLTWSGPFAVGASLRAGDAERLLPITDALGVQVLLAPRHPERFDPGALGGRAFVRRSALPNGEVPPDVPVVVLDSVGALAGELRGAVFVFVGGTFDPAIGGHSPWDAARAGVPVVAGPCVEGQGDAFARVGAAVGPDLAASVRDRRTPRPPTPVAASVAARIEALAQRPAPETRPRPWALPLVPGVQAATAARRRLTRPVAFPVPVVSVGSTNARSPGRTSTVRALLGLLGGRSVGVATRGYRRARGGRDLRLSWETTDAADLGDEGALLASLGAWVAAGPDRAAGVRALVERGAGIVLLDDGLSTVAVARDLELLVIDARYPRARGAFPAGDRREWDAVPARADLVLVHHGDGRFAWPGHAAQRSPTPWVRGDGASGPPPGPVAAWAAIGRGADFLASLDVPVARIRLDRDHTTPEPGALLAFAGGSTLVCTAKDAVRLPPEVRRHAAWRDVQVTLPDAVVARVKGL